MLEANTSLGKMLLQCLKMTAALLTEAISNLWSISHIRLIAILFAIKDTERTSIEPALAILAEVPQLIAEEILQHCPVLAATFWTAYRVYAKLQILKS